VTEVIGYNKDNREELWEAMLIYRESYRTLSTNPDTMDIALRDQERYQRILSTYVH
jgi:hypothetical protein